MEAFITENFENWNISGDSFLTKDTTHTRYRASSVRWHWLGASSITIPVDTSFKEKDANINREMHPTFSFWIYSEKKMFGKLKFEFGHDGVCDCAFECRLNFTGWRTGWVSYLRDMTGLVGEHIDFIRISSPESENEGTLYFDQIIMLSYIDPRLHMGDAQLPHIKSEDNGCWAELYEFSQTPPEPELPYKVEIETFETIEKIELHLLEYLSNSFEEQHIDNSAQVYSKLKLLYRGGRLKGPPPMFKTHNLIYPPAIRGKYERISSSNSICEYFSIMWAVARKINSSDDDAEKAEFENLFVRLFDFIQYHGWQPGSSMGSLKDSCRNIAQFAASVLLIKSSLRKRKRLIPAMKLLRWLAGTGRIYTWRTMEPGEEFDVICFQSLPIFISILLDDNARDKVRDLTAFSRWFSKALEPAPGLQGTLKPDGSWFCHYGPYPVMAALDRMENPMMAAAALAGTAFDVSYLAWKTLAKGVASLFVMSASGKLPVSMNGCNMGKYYAMPAELMYMLALAALRKDDIPMAEKAGGIYRKLTEGCDEPEIQRKNSLMAQNHIYPQRIPEGHWSMNYSATSIHRRQSWTAVTKGFSRYLWRNETLATAGLFGRYIAFGSMEIMPDDDELKTFRHDGWDWNFWPGVTGILKPVGALRAELGSMDKYSRFEERLLSVNAFAGGVDLEHSNGCFALSLSGHPKYEKALRARKSYCFFDDFIVCLGSGVSSEDDLYPVFTCIFQTPADNRSQSGNMPLFLGNALNVSRIDGSGNADTWMTDTVGNSYYLPEGDFTLTVGSQQSISHDGVRKTEGRFACAWLDHGIRPENEGYEYVVFPQNTALAQEFIAAMKSSRKAYSILRKDSGAHVVRYNTKNITAYIMFRSGPVNCNGAIVSVSHPALVMTRETASTFKLSVCCPDLNLYTDEDPDQFDVDGVQQEVSIYSRPWAHNRSLPLTLKVELNGKWTPRREYPFCCYASAENGNTIVEIECRDGLRQQMEFENIF
jgi:chondroitin-sulfate-ABC endolyase/exolyase